MIGKAPKGLICLIASGVVVPTGWALCDGSGGRPNLRDKFIRGASIANPPGGTGGSDAHTHTATSSDHGHGVTGGVDEAEAGSGFDYDTENSNITFTSDSENGLPPYHALRHIMSV